MPADDWLRDSLQVDEQRVQRLVRDSLSPPPPAANIRRGGIKMAAAVLVAAIVVLAAQVFTPRGDREAIVGVPAQARSTITITNVSGELRIEMPPPLPGETPVEPLRRSGSATILNSGDVLAVKTADGAPAWISGGPS